MQDLLARFVAAFKRGIEGELAAVRESAQASEIALTAGEELGGLRYRFAVGGALEPGTTAMLRSPRGEQRVTVERVEEGHATLLATQALDTATGPIALVVAPWFLYDRMIGALDDLHVDRHGIALALRLFGKQPHTRTPTELRCEHGELDASQRAAVQLCSDSDLAFIWGPPGTGKTMTLAHVVEELLAQGQRILLASTTNAAIDQILAKLAGRPWFAEMVQSGSLVRLGRSDADTFGAELGDVVARLGLVHRDAMVRLRNRIAEVETQLKFARALVAELQIVSAPQQSLFAPPPLRLRASSLAPVFGDLAGALSERPAKEQLRVVGLRITRLERVRVLAKAAVATHAAAARELEARVVDQARLVMCTLTTAYLSPLMGAQRFDALIAEEAGMATLPPLFHAAALCTGKAIVVGDPRQLPPIVQSDDDRVRRAIGRNVFEVTVPDPASSEVVAMLDVQYRMHPTIGAIVGRLFYGGRLVHRATGTEEIAARAPNPGAPVAVIDTAGRTRCERSQKGTSRVNLGSAEITADLAREAVEAGAASVCVITPYAAQAVEIRKLLGMRRLGEVVECSTIHRFQGRECDVVIVDLVDAAPMRPSALLAETPNLLNVSISRARGKLLVVADVGYFRAQAPQGIVSAFLAAVG